MDLILLLGCFLFSILFSVIHFSKELSSIHLIFILSFSSFLNIGRGHIPIVYNEERTYPLFQFIQNYFIVLISYFCAGSYQHNFFSFLSW